MKLSEFDYKLPKELIAQYPSEVRGEERLLALDRKSRSFKERRFSDITDYFKKGDVLVLNDAKVIPARIFARRKTGGRVEIFIVDKMKRPLEALIRSSGRIKSGESVILDSGREATPEGGREVKILDRADIGRVVEFDAPLDEILEKCGHVPLPPYISRPDEPSDKERYQTVYAKREGATASPTAGLHFTEKILRGLEEKGVTITYITLHVSYGTFAPIKEAEIEKHKMHSEFYRVPENSFNIITEALERKAKIFACGTTTLRALEASSEGLEGFTNLFIYPGYKFKIANALITNFHFPKSTILLLTSAFCGKKLLFEAYDYAIRNRFRFFSYGDAMVII